MEQRLRYIDLMKGITIILVVLHHFIWLNFDVLSVKNNSFEILYKNQHFFSSIIMPIFFFASGYCSNFNQKALFFIRKNIKSLIIPGIIFGLLINLVRGQCPFVKYVKTSIYYGYFSFWFLFALFYGKIIIWGLNKIFFTKKYLLLILFIFSMLSALLNDLDLFYNFCMHRQVLNLSIYIGVGMWLRNYKKSEMVSKIGVCIYVILSILFFGGIIDIPVVTASFGSTFGTEPLHLIYATSGCFALLYVCKKVGRFNLFESIGRQSLIIYMLHCDILIVLLKLLYKYNHVDSLVSTIFICVILSVVCICVCYCFALLINTKYIKWTIGKF